MPLPDDAALAIKANLAVITTLSAQIDLLEQRLQEKVTATVEALFNLLHKSFPK